MPTRGEDRPNDPRCILAEPIMACEAGTAGRFGASASTLALPRKSALSGETGVLLPTGLGVVGLGVVLLAGILRFLGRAAGTAGFAALRIGRVGWLHQLLREDATSQIDELALLSKEQGFPYWAAMATLFWTGECAAVISARTI